MYLGFSVSVSVGFLIIFKSTGRGVLSVQKLEACGCRASEARSLGCKGNWDDDRMDLVTFRKRESSQGDLWVPGLRNGAGRWLCRWGWDLMRSACCNQGRCGLHPRATAGWASTPPSHRHWGSSSQQSGAQERGRFALPSFVHAASHTPGWRLQTAVTATAWPSHSCSHQGLLGATVRKEASASKHRV